MSFSSKLIAGGILKRIVNEVTCSRRQMYSHGQNFINEVRIMGKLGYQPTMRDDRKGVLQFSLFTERIIHNRTTQESQTIKDWHTIRVSSPRLKEYVLNGAREGDSVMVTGILTSRSGLDQHGIERNLVAVYASNLFNLNELANENRSASKDKQVESESDLEESDHAEVDRGAFNGEQRD